MRIGMPELIIVLVIALLIFGPKKLPELGQSLGKAIRGFKKSMDEEGESGTVPACTRCGATLPSGAQFCSSCGVSTVKGGRE